MSLSEPQLTTARLLLRPIRRTDFDAWRGFWPGISPDNVMSQAVARKLGSNNRGPGRLPPPYEHAVVDIWGQTRVEWYAAHPA